MVKGKAVTQSILGHYTTLFSYLREKLCFSTYIFLSDSDRQAVFPFQV